MIIGWLTTAPPVQVTFLNEIYESYQSYQFRTIQHYALIDQL